MQKMQAQNTQIKNALNSFNSEIFYAVINSNDVVIVYPEADHPLTGSSSAVFQIQALSAIKCVVSFLDSDGFEVDTTICKIEGLAASIENDMIASGYKA